MKISELIAAVGDEQVGVQYLDECYISANTTGSKQNRHGVISFGVETSQVIDMIAGTESEKMAVIVWMPRKKVAEVLAADRLHEEEKKSPAPPADGSAA